MMTRTALRFYRTGAPRAPLNRSDRRSWSGGYRPRFRLRLAMALSAHGLIETTGARVFRKRPDEHRARMAVAQIGAGSSRTGGARNRGPDIPGADRIRRSHRRRQWSCRGSGHSRHSRQSAYGSPARRPDGGRWSVRRHQERPAPLHQAFELNPGYHPAIGLPARPDQRSGRCRDNRRAGNADGGDEFAHGKQIKAGTSLCESGFCVQKPDLRRRSTPPGRGPAPAHHAQAGFTALASNGHFRDHGLDRGVP